MLEQTPIISLKIQSNNIVIYEMRNIIGKSNENLNELKEVEMILPFPSNQVHKDGEDKITITLTEATLTPAKRHKLEEEISNLPQKQLEKSKEFVT